MRIWKTMGARARRSVAWMVSAIVVAAVACSDDAPSGSSLECGEGTVRSGDECVASGTGGSAGSAGASSGGSRTGGTAGVNSGTAGSGVTDGGDGGDDTTGGTGAGTGGSAGSGGNAGSGVAGAGMGGTAGAGGLAGGGGTGGMRTSHWLAYQHAAGIFAYDVGTFPEATGTLLAASGSFPTSWDPLGNAPMSPWSPDGSKLLYNSGGNLFVVDASTTMLGAPINLGASSSVVEWSGDSKSLLLVTAQVIDVSEAAPIRRPIVPTGMNFWGWAPLGNRFAYIDTTGLNVVSVVAGIPGQPTHLADGVTAFVWSPDATRLAAWVGGELSIVDLRGASAVVTDVTNPVAASPSVSRPMFSKDSSRLVYSGRQARDVIDFYVVNTASPSSSVRVALPGIADGVQGTYEWATNHNWVRWTAISSATENVVADLSGSMPASAALPAGDGYQWVPGELKLLARNAAMDLVLVDAMAPAAAPRVIAPTSGSTFSMGGPGSAIAYEVVGLYFTLVDHAGMQGGYVTFTGGAGSNRTWEWSRDAHFIASTSAHTGTTPADYSLHLLRVDGVNASSAARLQERSRAVSTTFAWQP